MPESKTKYTIVCQNSRIKKDWLSLEKEYPDKVADCKEFLKNNPEDRGSALGLLKKLKGRFKGILQYDITKDDARVWYRVDRTNRQVIIKYAGHHPDWH
jgi:mRNA-degrading endonuclease RelE of RelBE toxin-antitoxin system